ncbi:MFS transporter [Marinomonas sp. 15G1-11]|uniref:MFS transporter n=1 Tax=Marinomonas phaeophyticola TaxID=3004091 RepID=A0ABT4JY99_9GAMM|nr:MFS transporter [Marinomonas sp. 15G1-11]MCZ2723195.1 MFS transporter [Marinomonas sp. 15G1-11]
MSSLNEKNVIAGKASRIILLACLTSVGIGQSFIFTSLPPIGREIGLSDVRISSIITIGAIFFVIGAFLWGGIIARIGRMKSILFGMSSYVITLGFTGFVLQQSLLKSLPAETTYYLLICLRIVFGLGISGIVPAIQTYLVLHGDPNKRSSTIASIGASFSIGMILGPALASFASSISLTAPFYLIAAFAVLLFLLVFLIVKDTTHVKVMIKPKSINWLKHPALPFLIMSTLVILGITGIQQIMGFLLQDRFGWSAVETTTQLGYAMMVMSLMSILVQMVLVPKFELGPTMLIYLGVLFAVIAQVCFITMQSYFGIVLAMGLFGICCGFLFPGVITAQTILAENDEQSRLASVNASLQGVGGASGPILMASLYQINSTIPFVFLGIAYLILFMAFLHYKVRIHHKIA